eukprot:jgi/Chlat1/5228/Chrsp33S05075
MVLLVDGHPLPVSNKKSETSLLSVLLGTPSVAAAAQAFATLPALHVRPPEVCSTSASDNSVGRFVYVFQREYATVQPGIVQVVGTDEMTTCIAIVLRGVASSRVAVAHVDSPNGISVGLAAILSSMPMDSEFELHLVGAYVDVDAVVQTDGVQSPPTKTVGHSLPLAATLVNHLHGLPAQFLLQTACILHLNTELSATRLNMPAVRGVAVMTATGAVVPTVFHPDARSPDAELRGLRCMFAEGDARLALAAPYVSDLDMFRIEPFRYSAHELHPKHMLSLPDKVLLQWCSTSPAAESVDFIPHLRRNFQFLVKYKHWKMVFPGEQPRMFERRTQSDNSGLWFWEAVVQPVTAVAAFAK